MSHYHFHPKLVLRTPSETFDPKLDSEIANSYLQNPEFMEAIYLASPSLFEALHQQMGPLDTKTLHALAKYILRNRSRATPFGLFSGVGVVEWGDVTDIMMQDGFDRHTRLDMNYLCALTQVLNQHPLIRRKVLFYPNNSIYQIGEEYRYIEYTYEGSNRKHQISSIQTNEYIDQIVQRAQSGAHFYELVDAIADDEIQPEEAQEFINDLIDYQLLVSELEPAITGAEFLDQIIQVLAKEGIAENEDAYISEVVAILKWVKTKLLVLDQTKCNTQEAYEEIAQKLAILGVEFDKSKLFQTDKVLKINQSKKTLSKDLQNDFAELMETLNNYALFKGRTHLADFIDRFYARYEDQEVALLTALDTESGVGYASNTSQDYTPLTDGLILPKAEKERKSVALSENDQKLFEALQKATSEKVMEVNLSSIGLKVAADVLPLPASVAVMFKMVDDKRILIDSIGGSSAANLLGRFGHASLEVAGILTDIADEEQERNPEVLFAEIVHLPESRTGNILLRPAFRSFEIPYLAMSSRPNENQLLLQDILVSIKNGKVVLRHKHLHKVIIPRLGTAHNFTQESLPVYHFLCDLQTQGLHTGTGFSWGQMAENFIFLPRVTSGDIILCPATWQFSEDHINELWKSLKLDSGHEWCVKYHVPTHFLLAEGDNELFIDREQPLLWEIFLASIKGKISITLKEYFWNESIPVKNSIGKPLSNQLIATLIKEKPTYEKVYLKKVESQIQRTFSFGSEWLYVKLYCGAKSADLILKDGISLLVQEAKEKEWIDSWFFIRYTDPDLHIRFRVHLTDKSHLQDVMVLFEKYIKPFEEQKLLWKIQTDTYQRELERYGLEAIIPSEKLFCIDSEKYFEVLALMENMDTDNTKWLWTHFNIDMLLTQAGFNTAQKLGAIEKLRDLFAAEFYLNQDLKTQMDKKYRVFRSAIESCLSFPEDGFEEIRQRYECQTRKLLKELADILNNFEDYEHVLTSHIHMQVNRAISSNQRLHELLIYDFLYRHYRSALARERKA